MFFSYKSRKKCITYRNFCLMKLLSTCLYNFKGETPLLPSRIASKKKQCQRIEEAAVKTSLD